jgi:hypothetical protein
MRCIGKMVEECLLVAVLRHQLRAVEQIGLEVSAIFRACGEDAGAPQTAAKEPVRQETFERLTQERDELIDVGIIVGAAKSPRPVEVSVDSDVAA